MSKYFNTYIVRIQNVEKEKVKQYINYLESETHSNHLDNTTISNNEIGGEYFLKINDKKIEDNKINYPEGRKLKHSNKSLTFNIPKDYKTTIEDLKTIKENVFKELLDLYEENDIEVYRNDFFCNIHNQENSHINFVIPSLDHSGKSIRFIKSQDKFYKNIAAKFTVIVDKQLNTNFKTYKEELYEDKGIVEETLESVLNDTLNLEELEKGKLRNKDNKLIKRLFTYMIRLKKKQDQDIEDNKTIENLKSTIKKVQEDGNITSEEEDMLWGHLRGLGLDRRMLGSKQKKTITKNRRLNGSDKINTKGR